MLIPLTLLALVALAANSVLVRLAIVGFEADPGLFAIVRVASGAIVLALLALPRVSGAWPTPIRAIKGAVYLAGYMVGFSLAYRTLDAGVGALLLFGSVQVAIFGLLVASGDRPPLLQWIGAVIALGGLGYLLQPSPDLADVSGVDVALMVVAGVCWGAYTLLGRGAGDPVRVNAMSFILSLPLVLPLALFATQGLTGTALWLAVMSGALTSGLGYALWYHVVSRIPPTLAGVGQLSVPVIAAYGGVIVIGEPITMTTQIGSAIVLGGIGLSLIGQRKRST